jgi:hypothetical protein
MRAGHVAQTVVGRQAAQASPTTFGVDQVEHALFVRRVHLEVTDHADRQGADRLVAGFGRRDDQGRQAALQILAKARLDNWRDLQRRGHQVSGHPGLFERLRDGRPERQQRERQQDQADRHRSPNHTRQRAECPIESANRSSLECARGRLHDAAQRCAHEHLAHQQQAQECRDMGQRWREPRHQVHQQVGYRALGHERSNQRQSSGDEIESTQDESTTHPVDRAHAKPEKDQPVQPVQAFQRHVSSAARRPRG